MRQWFADGVFRAVLRNATYLGSTKLVGALMGLVALACAGRALDPAVFGVLMVIHVYATGAGAIIKFQSWQAVLRYGAPALVRGDRRQACAAIRFAFGLDVASGLIGMAAAMALLPLLAGDFGIGPGRLLVAVAYCTLVPTMAAATPTGVLRLLDRFDLLALQQLVTPVVRTTGAAAAYLGHFGFMGFLLAWYVGDLAGDVVLWAAAARELRRRDMAAALRPGLFRTARELPGAWGFVWTTNISISLDAAWGPVSNLVVAGALGPVGAGLYKIGGTLLDSAGKPGDLLTKGFYPEIMRLDPASDRPWRLAIRTGMLAGAMGLAVAVAVVLGGKPLIALAFGHEYVAAYPLLKYMVAGLVISMATFPVESLLYMVGRQRAAMVAQAIASLVYLGALAALARLHGLSGAGIAYVIGIAILALLRLMPALSSYRDRARHAR